jgi:hypothetical protein
MKEAIALAKELGCRRMMLGVMEGNERALRLYEKLGFKAEAHEDDEVYIDGSWRRNYVMGLELAPCVPKLEPSPRPKRTKLSARSSGVSKRAVHVRQLMNRDLDEVHRLQNCPESTKSTYRIPPSRKRRPSDGTKKSVSEKEPSARPVLAATECSDTCSSKLTVFPFHA